MKNSKISNFILEISQVLLVFLGMYSAVMCGALSIGLTVSRGVLALVSLLAAFLFYGLFTVLETFHHGKLYGMLGITLFFSEIPHGAAKGNRDDHQHLFKRIYELYTDDKNASFRKRLSE